MRTLLLLLTLYLPLLVQAGALESYKPRFGREQPLVAVVGENRMTELVDYLVPFSLLSRAGVAEVVALSTREGPLQMMPALRVEAQVTTAEYEQRYPQGADYLIVPAVHHSDDPVLTAFVAGQAARGQPSSVSAMACWSWATPVCFTAARPPATGIRNQGARRTFPIPTGRSIAATWWTASW